MPKRRLSERAVAGRENLAYISTITFLQLSNLDKLLLFASKHPHRNGKDHPKMSHVFPRAYFSLAWTPIPAVPEQS